jgi:hypothetical protein
MHADLDLPRALVTFFNVVHELVEEGILMKSIELVGEGINEANVKRRVQRQVHNHTSSLQEEEDKRKRE